MLKRTTFQFVGLHYSGVTAQYGYLLVISIKLFIFTGELFSVQTD
jgi:hypothetical protein